VLAGGYAVPKSPAIFGLLNPWTDATGGCYALAMDIETLRTAMAAYRPGRLIKKMRHSWPLAISAEPSPADLIAAATAAEHSSVSSAIELYQRAVAAQPSAAAAWDGLTRTLLRKRLTQEALKAARDADAIGLSGPSINKLLHGEDSIDSDDAEAIIAAFRQKTIAPQIRGRASSFVQKHIKKPAIHGELGEMLALHALPTTIRIETASACNLRCQHCTTGVAYDSTDRRVMRMDTFERVLHQVRETPSISRAILYLGGEPLLNKHHATMCRRVKDETQIEVTKFVTNAMLLDQDWCDKLCDAKVDQIEVSIDGHSPEENNQIRLRSDYATIRKNLLMLRRTFDERGVKTNIRICNVQFRQTNIVEHPARAATPPEFLVNDFPGFQINSFYAMVWPGMRAEDTGLSNLHLVETKPSKFCDHPFFDFAVRANGDIVLCCYDISGKHVVGNIHKDDFVSLYESPTYVDLRRAMIRRDENAVPDVCKRCLVFTGHNFVQEF
jgi:radical SAM protein with 4Fe4S-binding SPASM domain